MLMPLLVILTTTLASATVTLNTSQLKGKNNFETIMNVENFVDDFIKYKFYWNERSIHEIIKTQEGDCTDKAILKSYILRSFGIKTRIVSGYADNNKHDWLEYNINDKWETLETLYFKNIQKKRIGIW